MARLGEARNGLEQRTSGGARPGEARPGKARLFMRRCNYDLSKN